jgi:hypothetical protein
METHHNSNDAEVKLAEKNLTEIEKSLRENVLGMFQCIYCVFGASTVGEFFFVLFCITYFHDLDKNFQTNSASI